MVLLFGIIRPLLEITAGDLKWRNCKRNAYQSTYISGNILREMSGSNFQSEGMTNLMLMKMV
jgi:hypothetical protein